MFGKQITRKHVIAGAASVAVIGAALVPTFALAQSSTPDVPSLASGTAMGAAGVLADGDGLAFHLGGAGIGIGCGGAASEEIAAALGVTVDELEDAMHEARQATRPTERPTTPPTEEELEAQQQAFLAALASELGVTQEAVEVAIEAAQPTDEEIAAAKAERRVELEARLAERVADGDLTQEQADEILAAFDSGEGKAFGLGGRGGHGPRGGFGGFGGFFGGEAPAAGTSF